MLFRFEYKFQGNYMPTAALKKRIKRIGTVCAIAACALAFSGCGASVTVRDYTENGTRYNMYTVSIDLDTVRKMEASAATDANGDKYSVHGYFFELFSGLGCEIVDSVYTSDAYTASYRIAFSDTGADSGGNGGGSFISHTRLHDIAEAVEFSASYKTNPFVRKYMKKSANPFNGIRAEYDAVQPDETATVVQQLKNGRVSRDAETGERITFLPSVVDAFPYLRGFEPDLLKLNYAMTGSKRMSSSGTSRDLDGDYAEYVFSRYFDTVDTEIGLEYTRPVPYGWYGVALAAGGLVFGIIMLVTRAKKPKTTLLDRFPYNPEEFRDYDSHLPM